MKCPDGYIHLPDCVWNCSRGGYSALKASRKIARDNLSEKFPLLPEDMDRFGEAYHLRLLDNGYIPQEIRGAGRGICQECRMQIVTSVYVLEHIDTRQRKPGVVDTHWGQGGSVEYEYFIVDDSSSCHDAD